ncbi:DUF736 domain-containing protein [Sandaracinobacter sp. RS1-74]|uniref:DUF736 family protein n=1 Tax=Sandaracinobacteroides sayramensis TaxID=2913411 RepID=UPI001EDB3F75|nr:DUF736 family protein [Sandaracinobacteroides sayramensis]MCG2841281.1 DUF736 domain-containing protein [Sandaracinobacteroides sayramensis]
MQIGGFSRKPGEDEITGWIRTRTLDMSFVILRVVPEEQRTAKGGILELWEPNVAGNLAQVGTVWERPNKDKTGMNLYCLIDDPSFIEPIWGTFFRNDDGSFDVQWRRDTRPQEGTPGRMGAGGYQNAGGQRGGYGQRQGGGYGQPMGGGYGQRQGGSYPRQSGGSTAGPNGEYVGTSRDLDEEVPM